MGFDGQGEIGIAGPKKADCRSLNQERRDSICEARNCFKNAQVHKKVSFNLASYQEFLVAEP